MQQTYDVNLLLETKNEYAQELALILAPCLVEYYNKLYLDVLNKNKMNKLILREFQINIENVSKWTDSEKNLIYDNFKKKHEQIDVLINSVFFVRGKLITSIRGGVDKTLLDIETPQAFIYNCFLEMARIIWQRPNIFYHKISSIEKQKCARKIETIAQKTILETIRKCMPLKTITPSKTNIVKQIDSDDHFTTIKYEENDDTISSLEDSDEEDEEEEDEIESDKDDVDEEEEEEEEAEIESDKDDVDEEEEEEVEIESGKDEEEEEEVEIESGKDEEEEVEIESDIIAQKHTSQIGRISSDMHTPPNTDDEHETETQNTESTLEHHIIINDTPENENIKTIEIKMAKPLLGLEDLSDQEEDVNIEDDEKKVLTIENEFFLAQ